MAAVRGEQERAKRKANESYLIYGLDRSHWNTMLLRRSAWQGTRRAAFLLLRNLIHFGDGEVGERGARLRRVSIRRHILWCIVGGIRRWTFHGLVAPLEAVVRRVLRIECGRNVLVSTSLVAALAFPAVRLTFFAALRESKVKS